MMIPNVQGNQDQTKTQSQINTSVFDGYKDQFIFDQEDIIIKHIFSIFKDLD